MSNMQICKIPGSSDHNIHDLILDMLTVTVTVTVQCIVYSSGFQPGVLVSFVTLWPNNCDTSPLFLCDTLDPKI